MLLHLKLDSTKLQDNQGCSKERITLLDARGAFLLENLRVQSSDVRKETHNPTDSKVRPPPVGPTLK